MTGADSLLRVSTPDLGLLFDLKFDGRIEYGENYTPETSAKVLREAIADMQVGRFHPLPPS